MILRSISSATALAIILTTAGLSPSTARPQGWVTDSICPDDTPAVFHRCAIEAPQMLDPPRTPDGRPDLTGTWHLPYGDRGGAYEDLEEHPRTTDDYGGPTVVVDPPDGKVPILDWAEIQRRENVQRYIHHYAACLLSGVPNTMYHGETRQFLQTEDTFVVLSDKTHAYRNIELDGGPHVDENIRLWNGDSRGHWEGDTLVVETRNQNARSWLDQRGRFFTEAAIVVEHLTLIDSNTIHYQATIDDPNVYTQPFTISVPYRRGTAENSELLMEACYENNSALLELYRGLGYGIYPGISAEDAQ